MTTTQSAVDGMKREIDHMDSQIKQLEHQREAKITEMEHMVHELKNTPAGGEVKKTKFF